MSKRLFIGTLLETKDSERLYAMKSELDPLFSQWWKCKLRWVPAQKMHLTWLFFGDCDKSQTDQIMQFLKTEMPQCHEMFLEYDQLKFIGSKHRPNAMVLASSQIPQNIANFGQMLRKELGSLCQNKQDLAFLPHITMFRMPKEHKGECPVLEEIELSKYLPFAQRIPKISLIESHFGEGRSNYQVLAEFNLRDNK